MMPASEIVPVEINNERREEAGERNEANKKNVQLAVSAPSKESEFMQKFI